jgi:23S rRNA (guanosine2251-2'-O)-methyltransferase
MYIYGKNTVKEALAESKTIEKIFIANNDEILQLAKKNGLEVKECSKKDLDKMVKGNHQGVVAIVEDYKTYSLDAIINAIPEGKLPLLVMLDGIEDPHNLGAIIRTSDCAGVDGIIYKKHNAVSLNSTVAKVSSGGIENIKVSEVTNLTQTIKKLKDKGYWICGTDVNKASDYRALDYDVPLVLVIGAEGKGISRLVKGECDFLVKLPMFGKVSSLNASVAAGVLLYEINNKRYPL